MRQLSDAGIANAGFEARLLADAAEGDPHRLAALLARRLAREPMAFIRGRQGFWTLDLEVSPATLIPRADSETLIEAALAEFPDRTTVRSVLDLGTGTGCLLLAALAEFPAAWGLGIDVVPAAVALAARNALAAGFVRRASLLCADWAGAIHGQFQLILCNPPYIASADIDTLMPELRHEPRSALDGGADGVDAYRRLLPELKRLLAPDGAAIFEVGQGQHAAVAQLARHGNFSIASRRDLGGIVRALVLRNAAS